MTNNTTAAFDAHANEYDALRRRLVPCFDAFYGAAVALVADLGPQRVLDLGAGTGLLASMIASACPDAELHLLDGSARMLDQARATLGDRLTDAHVADLEDPLPVGAEDGGPFCAIVSALAIHHLDDAGKRALMVRIHDGLRPGGLFVNAEQVAGSTPVLNARYRAQHEAQARALGATDAEWDAAVQRMSHDRCSPVEDQLRWLREAGFTDVDCVFSDGRFAVLSGRRPA
ncbi:MAG: class SAM-dependent methyltransferase [Solirubrobacterales bacterium]|nr:class SAM-dependent methyltransferase [Solirubrobacterales bacterium]